MSDSDRSPADAAYLKALDLLSRRDRSRAELQQKLAARGHGAGAIDEALARLTDQGFIDDARFAASWVDSALRSGRGYGPRLALELRNRGIDRQLAAAAIAAATAETTETEVLAGIVARRFAGFDHRAATPREKQRVYGYLQRRGFSLTTIFAFFRNNDTE